MLVHAHYTLQWMRTKIKHLKAGREKEEDEVKKWNLDLKERYISWIREAIREEMASEADFNWVDSIQTHQREKNQSKLWELCPYLSFPDMSTIMAAVCM